MPYADLNDLRKLKNINKYNNSYRGFIITKIGHIFKPSKIKPQPGRNNVWAPECSKEDIWQKFMNYILRMKEKYPGTDGHICCYCKKILTYIANKRISIGKGHTKRGKMNPETFSNFSIDRWDSRITYNYNNIRFCCLGCNNRKNSSTPEDWDNFKEAKHETQ
jgi:5-methylcytosine-specific restriction endonuclease McrA